MRIKGFWHIYLINHWYSIVTDQLRILLTSGLYNASDEINISCLGAMAEKDLLQRLVVDIYPKLKIKFHSENALEYEFPALEMIEKDKTSFYGFYFHTKGVTRPNETIINHWRAWLNEAVLNKWEVHVLRLQEGYDVSGANYLPPLKHFSGNFFWFNNDYVKTLLPIKDNLDKTNRWHAEQWICGKTPKLSNFAYKEAGVDVYSIDYKRK